MVLHLSEVSGNAAYLRCAGLIPAPSRLAKQRFATGEEGSGSPVEVTPNLVSSPTDTFCSRRSQCLLSEMWSLLSSRKHCLVSRSSS